MGDGNYYIQVLLNTVEEGNVATPQEFEVLCEKIADSNNYKFCPGLKIDDYEDFKEVIRYDPKNVKLVNVPVQHVESIKCKRWFPFLNQHGIKIKEKRAALEVLCQECSKLQEDLRSSLRRLSGVTPEEKVKHQQANSFYPMKYLSPQSLQKRKTNLRTAKAKERRLIRRYVPDEITLDDKQHEEMRQILTTIDESASCELESIFRESESQGTQLSSTLRQVWTKDMQACHEKAQKSFFGDQVKNGNGYKGNRWSPLTIRIALAVYVRSPAAYNALQSFDILKLPSKSTLQAYTGVFLNGAGVSEDSIKRQAKLYESFKEEQYHKNSQAPQPQGDGVLIFDEVKVVSRLIWNSRSKEIIGLAMNPEDMASLQDIYSAFSSEQEPQQATYMLQFLWRDLTSKFDVMGPYFSSAESMKSKFILGCLYETIKLFQLYGFQTSAIVCDGASANLTALKTATGSLGAYGAKMTDKLYTIPSPKFENPFNPPNVFYWIICPSHQLKNMINALFSSKAGSTKNFVFGGVHFGWAEIEKMYDRECCRMDKGLARVVPKLREAHILRDSWTKLNVTPAKIMQQEEVMSELYSYTKCDPPPKDADSTLCTLRYLESCNLIFERGLLSHERIRSSDTGILLNLQKGYKFFCDWLDDVFRTDPKFSSTDPTQNKFLSWQTWDLLRIDVQGFDAFCKYFLSKHSNHFISPLRLSGSAIETIFGQFKFSCGGKLDAANYRVARAAFLTKQINECHHSGRGYRDVSLSINNVTVERKKYNKKK